MKNKRKKINLFLFEWRKLCGNHFLLGLLVFSLCLNAFALLTTKNDNRASIPPVEAASFFEEYTLHSEEMDAYYQQILEWDEAQELRWQEEMTKGNYYWEPENIPSIYAKEGYTDRQYFEWLFEWLNRQENYEAKIETVISNASRNLLDLESKDTSPTAYTWKYQKKIIAIYSSLKNTVSFSNEVPHGWQQFFSYEMVNIFLVLYTLVGAASLCMKEKSDGSIYLLHVTKRGRLPVIIAKLCVLSCWIGVSIVLFSVESLLLVGGRFGFSSPISYIQEISAFIYCPYALRIWQFFLIVITLKWIAFFAFAMLVFCVGIIIPDYAIISISGLAIVGVNVFLNTNKYVQPDNVLKNINLQAISYVCPLFSRYKGVNFFGYVINTFPFAACFYLLLLLVVICVILRLYNSNIPVSRDASFAKRIIKISQHKEHILREASAQTGLFVAEFYKSFRTPLLFLIILIVFFTGEFLFYENLILPTSYAEQVYREYMIRLEGPLTANKMEYLREERYWIDSVMNDSGKKKDEYLTGKIGVSEYADYLVELYNAEARDPVLTEVESYQYYISEHQSAGTEPWFVYDTGWETLFSDPFDWGLYVVLVLISVNVFPSEYKRNTSENSAANIIRCTKKGRIWVWMNKRLFLFAASIAVDILFITTRMFLLFKTYTFTSANAPVISLRFLNLSSCSMTILQFAILVYAVKFIATCSLAFFCCAISSFTKKQIPAILVTSMVSFLPSMASCIGLRFISKYGYISFFLAVPLFASGDIVCILVLHLSYILLLDILSMFFWSRNK